MQSNVCVGILLTTPFFDEWFVPTGLPYERQKRTDRLHTLYEGTREKHGFIRLNLPRSDETNCNRGNYKMFGRNRTSIGQLGALLGRKNRCSSAMEI